MKSEQGNKMGHLLTSLLILSSLVGCGAKSAYVFTKIPGVKIKNGQESKPTKNVEVFFLVNGSNAPKYDFGYADESLFPEVNAKVVNVGSSKANLISHLDLGSEFEIIDTNNCLTNLELRAICDFSIRFSGTEVGDYLKTLSFTYESPDRTKNANTNIIALSGSKIKDYTPPELKFPVLIGNLVDFGSVTVGSTRSRLIEVKNVGNAPAEISLTNFDEKDFSFAGGKYPGQRGTCKSQIDHETCFLDLRYSPSLEGEVTGELVLEYSGKMAEVGLKGNGTTASTCKNSYDVLLTPSLTGDEKAVYPYLFKAPNTIKKLQKLYWMETNFNYEAGVYTGVRDGQILTSYLIPEEIKGKKIIGGNVRFSMNKMVENVNHYSTELFCLSLNSLKTCSGNLFIYEDWIKLLNKDFWQGKKPVNNKFTSLLLDPSHIVKLSAKTSIYSLQKLVDLRTLFSTSVDSITANLDDKYLNLLFVDDIHLEQNNYLLLTVEDSCSP